ncbi:MAG: tetratricopeptide repeat protein [Bacteroidota bacterium]
MKASNLKADSLVQVLQNTRIKEDRIDILLQLETLHARDDSAKAAAFIQEALELAHEANDKVRYARCLHAKGKLHFFADQYTMHDSLTREALSVFLDHDKKEDAGDCLNNLGSSNYRQGKWRDAELYFRRSLECYEPNDELYLSTALNIAIIMNTQKRFTESLPLLNELLHGFHEKNDRYNYSNCIVLMANVYQHQGDLERAIKFNKDFIEQSRLIGSKTGIAGGYSNLAQVFFEKGEPQQAIVYAEKASEIFSSMTDKLPLCRNMNFIGVVHKEMKEYNEALELFDEAINIAEEKGFNHQIAEILNNKGELYAELGNYARALELLNNSYAYAKENNMPNLVRDASYNLYEVHKLKRDYKTGLSFFEVYNEYKDTLISNENKEKVLAQKINFDIAKADYENERLRNDNELQQLQIKNQRTQLIIGGLILLFIAGIVILLFIYSRRLKLKNELIRIQKDELKKANQLKDYMFSIIAHDLRGPLGNMKLLLEQLNTDMLLNDKSLLEEVFSSMKDAAVTTYNLLENMLAWARNQKEEIQYNPAEHDLNSLVNEIVELKKPAALRKQIDLQKNINNEIRFAFDYDMMHLVLRNLVDNAIKFTPERGTVKITGNVLNNNIEVAVIDSGVGIPKEIKSKLLNRHEYISTYGTTNEKGSGLGLKVCYDFIKRHNGDLQIDSRPGKGSKFSFLIPVN